jgi:hypothetical protein
VDVEVFERRKFDDYIEGNPKYFSINLKQIQTHRNEAACYCETSENNLFTTPYKDQEIQNLNILVVLKKFGVIIPRLILEK